MSRRSSFSMVSEAWPLRIRHSSHQSRQHASPSGRWPMADLDTGSDPAPLQAPTIPSSPDCTHAECGGCWMDYPESFPGWTSDRMRKSGIEQSCVRKVDELGNELASAIYHLDVGDDGQIMEPGRYTVSEENTTQIWETMKKEHPKGVRVRTIFVENPSVPVLQILGTRYKIDPYFFSSSSDRTHSRHQGDFRPSQGDRELWKFVLNLDLTNHTDIMLTLTFPSTIRYPQTPQPPPLCEPFLHIDTLAPLELRSSNQMLFIDLLAVYMVRAPDSSTIISNHLTSELHTTSAKYLHSRAHLVGLGVTWKNIFQTSRDPTFVLLMMLWHALSTWDKALDALYKHFFSLETRLMMRRDEDTTQELHVIRPHLFRYISLLEEFRQSVIFILETLNPAMDSWPPLEREKSNELLRRECNEILADIDRLKMRRRVLDMRLANVLSLVSSSFNFATSRQAVRDSAAMKQISYLTMVFLPASFVSSVFGMNIKEISPQTYGSLGRYFGVAIPLTFITVWVIVAAQSQHYSNDPDATLWMRICWPVLAIRLFFEGHRTRRRGGMGNSAETLV